ncbi:DUF4931 domain-containing protein [Pediococcus acidilactici]|nr:DUF4931 domain-containing protein [Pediococcus acidilactici]UWF32969.1 DUF4931 domain-containing protein [Pediococcus acidilactici]
MNKLIFNPRIAKNKPNDVNKSNEKCPFCNVDNLENILCSNGSKIWLMNKYRTLENATQTLIIESAKHRGDFSNYSEKECFEIISFALSKWEEMNQSQKYQSVALYKNFGPLSGGSLQHPHLQIVGFEDLNCNANVCKLNFKGPLIFSKIGISLTISDSPIMGFTEVNVCLEDERRVRFFAEMIRKVCKYFVQEYYDGRCNSYNLFFYKIDTKVFAKVIPRFVDSPYFVGYRIPQVNDEERTQKIVEELRQYVNNDENEITLSENYL